MPYTQITRAGAINRGRFIRPLLAILIGGALQYPPVAASPAAELSSVSTVVKEMCGKSLALLGESSVHGFGKTLEFKVELVRRLVDECHYDAVFFESGIYDFLNLQQQAKSGHEVTDSKIAAAIGGLWANKEVEPLIPYLRQKLASGTVSLGGLDDQLGRGTWAQKDMPSALSSSLSVDGRSRCLAILQRHTQWQYASDAPYSPQDKTRILGCLDSIGARLHGSNAPNRDNSLAMVDSLKRLFERDFPTVPAGVDEATFGSNKRDRSMYLNFRWLLAQLGSRHKAIVWAATVHVAKGLSGVPGNASRIPLGFYLHQDFGDQAFALGFSAYSGTYARVGQSVQTLNPAPNDSLENRSLAGRSEDLVYRSRDDLRTAGQIPSRLLGTNFTTAQWDLVIDGLIILRREQPPEYLNLSKQGAHPGRRRVY